MDRDKPPSRFPAERFTTPYGRVSAFHANLDPPAIWPYLANALVLVGFLLLVGFDSALTSWFFAAALIANQLLCLHVARLRYVVSGRTLQVAGSTVRPGR